MGNKVLRGGHGFDLVNMLLAYTVATERPLSQARLPPQHSHPRLPPSPSQELNWNGVTFCSLRGKGDSLLYVCPNGYRMHRQGLASAALRLRQTHLRSDLRGDANADGATHRFVTRSTVIHGGYYFYHSLPRSKAAALTGLTWPAAAALAGTEDGPASEEMLGAWQEMVALLSQEPLPQELKVCPEPKAQNMLWKDLGGGLAKGWRLAGHTFVSGRDFWHSVKWVRGQRLLPDHVKTLFRNLMHATAHHMDPLLFHCVYDSY
jgi:hypothetical protein